MAQQTTRSDDEILKEGELAARWKTSRRSLQRWRAEGSGPPFLRIEGAIRYRLVDVTAYEERQRCQVRD